MTDTDRDFRPAKAARRRPSSTASRYVRMVETRAMLLARREDMFAAMAADADAVVGAPNAASTATIAGSDSDVGPVRARHPSYVDCRQHRRALGNSFEAIRTDNRATVGPQAEAVLVALNPPALDRAAIERAARRAKADADYARGMAHWHRKEDRDQAFSGPPRRLSKKV